MSEVRIKWTQRAAGRDVGDEESVELTDFVAAIIAQGRVEVISEAAVVPEVVVHKRPKRVEVAEAVLEDDGAPVVE